MAESPVKKRVKGADEGKGVSAADSDKARTIRAEFNATATGQARVQQSDAKTIDGFEWTLNTETVAQNRFVLYVKKRMGNPNDYCYVRTRVKLFTSASDDECSKYQCSLDRMAYFGQSRSLTFTAMDLPTGRDAKFYAEAHIEVLRSWPTSKTRDIDFKLPSPSSDVILIVGETKLHVGKQILANRSKFFERLFYGDFKETKMEEIKIKDVDVELFTEFLEHVYNRQETIDDWNVPLMLELADRFDCPEMMSDYEKVLVQSSSSFSAERLFLAEKYNLNSLLDKCLLQLKTREDVRRFLLLEKAENISAELKELLTCKLLLDP